MTIEFKRVSKSEEVSSVVELANIIWPEHYTPIIGAEQVKYMLSTFHSYETIATQVKTGEYQYYLMTDKDQQAGYLAVKPDKENLFLSKLYLLAECRGNGFGRQAIKFIKELASENNCKQINLTVNKYNSGTIEAYKKIGFVITEEIVADIGGGYVMDDYKMELKL